MLVLFAVAASYAISVDVPRTGYGVKSDEATYVATALSAAYDGNLSFERRDLERFESLYQSGPEGIFLKRGKQLRIHPSLVFPFVRTVKLPDPDANRLYFGKALIYPFVRRAIRPHPGPQRPAAVQRLPARCRWNPGLSLSGFAIVDARVTSDHKRIPGRLGPAGIRRFL